MSIEDRLTSSPKRSLATYQNDELSYQSTSLFTTEDEPRQDNQSLISNGENETITRIRTSKWNEGAWIDDLQGGILVSLSCGGSITSLPRAALPAHETPYVSFGEGADPTQKRIMTAAHKHVYALDSNKLLCRLRDVPAKNAYVPPNMRDPTPSPPSGGSTDIISPSDTLMGFPPEERDLEIERRIREGNRIRAAVCKRRVNLVSTSADNLPSATRQYAALPNVNPSFPEAFSRDATSTQDVGALPTHPTPQRSGEIQDHLKSKRRLSTIITSGRLPSSPRVGKKKMQRSTKMRGGGTVWEGRL
jgi:hypothetical protein